MRTMHLFAGIGGGLLADLILGHTPVVAVEWDKYACKVLRERAKDGWFPDLQVWEGDVRMFNPSEYAERVDCIHAGFPCQDISNAGKQAGVEEGTRSGLYREVLRIAGVVQPRFIFLENVSAILSVGLGTVLGDLASRGYDARWLCIKASDVGANHRRDRWFLLGYATREYSNGFINNTRELVEPEKVSKFRDASWTKRVSDEEWTKFAENMAYSKLCGQLHGESKEHSEEARINAFGDFGASCEDVAYASSIRQSGQRKYVGQVNSKTDCDRKTNRIINSGKRSEGWWKSEPYVGRVVDGDSSRIHRLKGLGNMQVPLQAAVAFKLLIEGLEND